jgi:DNA-directed RNA polymerase specialized sigma24 family protein
MSRKHEPVFTSIEGVEVAILSREAYDLLNGQRRQLGALSSQLRSLKQALTDATTLLDEIEDTLGRFPSLDEDGASSREAREHLMSLLEGRDERFRRAAHPTSADLDDGGVQGG